MLHRLRRVPSGGWLVLAAGAPFLLNALVIARYAVNVPVADEWVIALFLSKLITRNVHLADLIRQANESRIAFPRLILAPLAFATGWDTRYEVVLSQLLLAVTGALLVVVSRRTLRLSWAATAGLAFLSVMLMASTMQSQNLLWGIQIIVYIPGFCLMACAAVATTRWPFARKVIAQALLTLVATYSYANGMTLWVIVPLLWIGAARQASRAVRWGAAAGWAAVAVLALALYFTNYFGGDTGGNLRALLDQPAAAAGSLLRLLGAPLSTGVNRRAEAAAAGVALIVAAIVALWRLRRYKDLDRALPWLAMLAYGAAASGLIVLGRFRGGVDYPMLGDRYVAFTAYVYLAVFHLIALGLTAARPAGRWVRRSAWVAAALIVALHGRVILDVLPTYPAIRVRDLQSKAGVWLVRAAPLGPSLRKVTQFIGQQGPVKDIAATLANAGLIHPTPLATLRAGIADVSGDPQYGAIEHVTVLQPGRLRIGGWCYLQGRGDACDAVVITPAELGGVDRPCAVIFPSEPRPDIPAAIRPTGPLAIGWAADVDCGTSNVVDAWAVDSLHAQLNRLARR